MATAAQRQATARAALPRLARLAVRVTRDPSWARSQAAIARDLLATRRSAEGWKQSRPRTPERGRVLIVSLSDFVYQLKLESVLGTALRLEGLRPVVLTHRGTRWAVPYFRAFGIDDIRFTEDLAAADETQSVRDQARELLAGPLTVQGLKELTFRGAHVGQQTLSSISRTFERGRISLDDADVRRALDRILPEAMASVLMTEQLLDELRPEMLLFNETGYAGFGSIYDVALARNVNVVRWVHAGIHLPNGLMLKRYTEETRRVHPTSLSAASWSEVKALPWGEAEEAQLAQEFAFRYGRGSKHPDAGLQELTTMKSPGEIVAGLGLDPGKKTAVLFSHILWDANMFYGDDLFEDQETWLVESVRAMVENPNVNWIVKLHPANRYKAEATVLNDEVAIRERLGELPAHIRLLQPDTDVNTHSLFGLADYGLTIRGTVGLELPCFGAPVLTAGTGRYSDMGFTNDSSTAEEYLDKMRRIHELPALTEEETLLAKRHALALFRYRSFPFESYRAQYMATLQLHHPLSSNLELVPRTREGVESAQDLRELADWALDRNRADYLRVS
jgi:hypothetical protein